MLEEVNRDSDHFKPEEEPKDPQEDALNNQEEEIDFNPTSNEPLNIESAPERKDVQETPKEETKEEEISPKKPKSESTDYPELNKLNNDPNRAFDRSQEESQENNEIYDKLEDERKKELEEAGRKLKQKMLNQQRCYVCTLSFPCKHFKSLEEAYNQSTIFSHQKNISKEDTILTMNKSKSKSIISPPKEKPKKLQSKFLKKGDGILPGIGLKSNPEKEMKIKEDKKMHRTIVSEFEQCRGPQRVRIQKGPGKYEVVTLEHGQTLKEMDKETKKKQQRKEDKERCKQLEKLIKYRENKLKQDQEMIKYEKKQKEKEKKKQQKLLEKQSKHNEELKKKIESWNKEKEERQEKEAKKEKKERQRRKEKEKAQEEYFEKQKDKISGYRQELHQKNTEVLQFLSTTKSEKELGHLKFLKDPGVIERVDLGNDYHLPQIIRTVEMMEEEKKVCERFLCKHKTNLNKIHPRSRRLTRRSPMTHRSRNNYDAVAEYSKTQARILSPQGHKQMTQQVYRTSNSVMVKKHKSKNKVGKEAHKQSPIQKYVSKRAEKAKKNQEGEKQEKVPQYSDEKVTMSFGTAKKVYSQEEAPKEESKQEKPSTKPFSIKSKASSKPQFAQKPTLKPKLDKKPISPKNEEERSALSSKKPLSINSNPLSQNSNKDEQQSPANGDNYEFEFD